MSVRTLALGLAFVALAVGAWKVFAPRAEATSREAADDVSAMLATTSQAAFTGASASLEIQRRATGSYAGAHVAANMSLVRADAAGYCVQTTVGSAVQHLAGPGGTPAAGPC
jgi:hypothetical protein